jgi:hypothetical protein
MQNGIFTSLLQLMIPGVMETVGCFDEMRDECFWADTCRDISRQV